MARINIDEQIAQKINAYDIIAELQALIQAELDRPDDKVDLELVDECVEALLKIEQDQDKTFVALVPLVSSESFLKRISVNQNKGWKGLNKFARVAIVAAIITSSTFTVNAAVEGITGVNMIETATDAIHDKLVDIGILPEPHIEQIDVWDDDDEETTTEKETETTTEKPTEETTTQRVTEPETTTTTKSVTEKVKPNIEQLDVWDDDDEEETTTTKPTTTTTKKPTTTQAPDVTRPTQPTKPATPVMNGFKAELDGFKTDYIYGEELSYDGITLKAVYSDGSEKEVDLEDCSYTRSIDMTTTGDHTLRIIYEGYEITINITVRPDEETRGSEICSNDLYDYLLTDRGAYITAYRGNEQNISLDTIDSHEVYAICADVFSGKEMKTVTAQNVKKVFPNAFKGCSQMVDCFIPSAEYIGNSAFEGCTKLEEAVFSYKLNYLGEAVYKSSGIKSLSLPSAFTEIPRSLCEECSSLEEVSFSGKVTTIGPLAFYNCSALTMVNGTADIITVREHAFNRCSVMNFSDRPMKLQVAEDYAFGECYKLDLGTLSPDIKSIGRYSFLGCYLLTDVDIPASIEEIPEGAFRASHIATLTLHDGLKKIGDCAFMSTAITTISLPQTLEEIATYGLYATRLRSVYFNGDVKVIDEQAFYQSNRLKFYVKDNTYPLEFANKNYIDYEII